VPQAAQPVPLKRHQGRFPIGNGCVVSIDRTGDDGCGGSGRLAEARRKLIDEIADITPDSVSELVVGFGKQLRSRGRITLENAGSRVDTLLDRRRRRRRVDMRQVDDILTAGERSGQVSRHCTYTTGSDLIEA